jgi:hypothetical protein
MIYMDVTSACESSLNTGIQRVIRNLWSVLIERRPDAVPIVWDNKRCSYYSLSKAEGLFLKDPFHGKTISNARPRSSLFSKTTKRVKKLEGANEAKETRKPRESLQNLQRKHTGSTGSTRSTGSGAAGGRLKLTYSNIDNSILSKTRQVSHIYESPPALV